jgi:hypothetical protein
MGDVADPNDRPVPFIEAVRASGGGGLVDQFRVPSDVVTAVHEAAQSV